MTIILICIFLLSQCWGLAPQTYVNAFDKFKSFEENSDSDSDSGSSSMEWTGWNLGSEQSVFLPNTSLSSGDSLSFNDKGPSDFKSIEEDENPDSLSIDWEVWKPDEIELSTFPISDDEDDFILVSPGEGINPQGIFEEEDTDFLLDPESLETMPLMNQLLIGLGCFILFVIGFAMISLIFVALPLYFYLGFVFHWLVDFAYLILGLLASIIVLLMSVFPGTQSASKKNQSQYETFLDLLSISFVAFSVILLIQEFPLLSYHLQDTLSGVLTLSSDSLSVIFSLLAFTYTLVSWGRKLYKKFKKRKARKSSQYSRNTFFTKLEPSWSYSILPSEEDIAVFTQSQNHPDHTFFSKLKSRWPFLKLFSKDKLNKNPLPSEAEYQPFESPLEFRSGSFNRKSTFRLELYSHNYSA